jgi:hypothetical protein
MMFSLMLAGQQFFELRFCNVVVRVVRHFDEVLTGLLSQAGQTLKDAAKVEAKGSERHVPKAAR